MKTISELRAHAKGGIWCFVIFLLVKYFSQSPSNPLFKSMWLSPVKILFDIIFSYNDYFPSEKNNQGHVLELKTFLGVFFFILLWTYRHRKLSKFNLIRGLQWEEPGPGLRSVSFLAHTFIETEMTLGPSLNVPRGL